MHTFFRFVRFRFLQLPLQLAVYHSRHYLPKNITVIFQALLYHTQDIVIPLKTSDIMPRHYDTSLDLIYYSRLLRILLIIIPLQTLIYHFRHFLLLM